MNKNSMPNDNNNDPNTKSTGGFNVVVSEEPTAPGSVSTTPILDPNIPLDESGLPKPIFQDPSISSSGNVNPTNQTSSPNPIQESAPTPFNVIPSEEKTAVSEEEKPLEYEDLYSKLLAENEKAQTQSIPQTDVTTNTPGGFVTNPAPVPTELPTPIVNNEPPAPASVATSEPIVSSVTEPVSPLTVNPYELPPAPAPVVIETPASVSTGPSLSEESPVENTGAGNGGVGDGGTNFNDEVPPPRRGFPKYLLFLLGGILLLVVVIMLVKSLFTGKKSSATTNLTWWGLWEEESVVKPLIDEYQTQNPNVKITYVKNSQQDYRDRLTSAINKSQGPDIFMFHNTWVPHFKKDLDTIPTSVMANSEYQSTYYEVIANNMSVGTNFVGFPFGYEALTLFINEEMFSQAGLQPPKTWVELREMAPKFVRRENGKITRAGVALGRTENVDHWQEIVGLMMVQNKVDLKNPNGKKLEDALKYFVVFSATDKVWDETLPPSTQMFANGKLAMYFGPSWRALNLKQLNPNLKFKTVPVPQLPKNDPGEADISYATYWANGVWSKSKNTDEAWKFMKFMNSKESLTKLYKAQVERRGIGVAYPRIDMKDLIKDDPILGSIVSVAPHSQTWYLQSRTFDGETGINTQLSKYFEDAINAFNQGTGAEEVLKPLNQGVLQVLQQYSLVK